MKQLPYGMYQQGNSVIHRLDATIKIILLVIILTAVVTTNTLIGYIILIAFTALAAAVSKIGINASLGNVKRMTWFFIIIFIMNFCFYKTENAWISFWIFTPSYEGFMQGIKVVVRVIVLLILCNILNASTPPIEITKAVENIILPLKIFKVPTEQIALIITVAIQFVPTLFEEADMIKKAQTARGAKFESRKLKDKAAAVIPMVVPIFVSAFRRADELSMAMEARGYRIDTPHCKRNSVHISLAEIISLALCTTLCVLQITLF
ncbi:MAG: energy-coupling factor transporter transmembrane protein EcfT [Acetobacter sp.]|nr:energy-coupling factor transporter transmembrane protein EcfT [Bacteroides sp.]MCM1341083.1 energy-coupling factor transporter transmembrane protein EcfT [Acetobacter sp.]MCM1433584.1 energy-coupling factor transporter transmembrane protein EcfT [Clostridiales bacterium]